MQTVSHLGCSAPVITDCFEVATLSALYSKRNFQKIKSNVNTLTIVWCSI